MGAIEDVRTWVLAEFEATVAETIFVADHVVAQSERVGRSIAECPLEVLGEALVDRGLYAKYVELLYALCDRRGDSERIEIVRTHHS